MNWLSSLFLRPYRNLTGIAVSVVSGVNDSDRLRLGPMNHDCVFRAVNLISSKIATIPLRVHERLERGKRRAVEHPAYRLLRRTAHPALYLSSSQLIRTAVGHALLYGNGYSWIERDPATFMPIGLHPIDPGAINPVLVNGRLWYKMGDEIRDPSQVLHIRGLGFDGMQGYSVVSVASDTFARANVINTYAHKFFENAAIPPVIIKTTADMKKESRERFLEQWAEYHAGNQNFHKPAILTGSADIEVLNVNAKDSQLLESRAFSRKEIANWFNLPPHKLGDDKNTSYASLEQENRAMLDDCLNPWLVEIENECFQKLLTEQQKESESHLVEFDRDAFLQADVKTTHEVLAGDIQCGILSRNEARAVLNLNAYDGGDDYLVPLNMERPGRESESESENPPGEASRSDPRIGEMAALFTRRLVLALNKERARANPKYARIRDAFHDELGVLMGSRQAAYERLAAFIMDYEKTPDADAAGLESDETLASYFVEGVTV